MPNGREVLTVKIRIIGYIRSTFWEMKMLNPGTGHKALPERNDQPVPAVSPDIVQVIGNLNPCHKYTLAGYGRAHLPQRMNLSIK